MQSKGIYRKAVLVALLVLLPLISYYYLRLGEKRAGNLQLKKYGPREYDELTADTIYHTIPPFEFNSHDGSVVNNRTFAGSIYVADFFFTNCQGVCPKMTNNLTEVQRVFIDFHDVKILSHTVDPKRDSVEALSNYADQYSARPGKWYFVTGKKKELYQLARKGYFITASDGDGSDQDFVHSEKFVLVDKSGMIRGYYDGTDGEDVVELIEDIYMLILESERGKG